MVGSRLARLGVMGRRRMSIFEERKKGDDR